MYRDNNDSYELNVKLASLEREQEGIRIGVKYVSEGIEKCVEGIYLGLPLSDCNVILDVKGERIKIDMNDFRDWWLID